MYIYELSFPVRYYETDQMGVVHHSNYIRYFECARNAMMAEWNYPIEKCEAEGFYIPIVEVKCKYRYPARMGDTLVVSARIDTLPLAKLKVSQEVRKADGTLCAEGEVTLGFTDTKTGRPLRCPAPLLDLISDRLKENDISQ